MRLSDAAGTWYRLGEAYLLLNRRADAIAACARSLGFLQQMSSHDQQETGIQHVRRKQDAQAFLLLRAALAWAG
jgi:hypothetical protein